MTPIIVDDFADADFILRSAEQLVGTSDYMLCVLGRSYLSHARSHLTVKLDLYFRGTQPIQSEQHAQALLRNLAADLRDTAEALSVTAAALREAGKAHLAGKAMTAARKALDTAEGYLA
jgi:hypothetical protein